MKYKNMLAILMGIGAIFSALMVLEALEPQPALAMSKQQVKLPISIVEMMPSDHNSSISLLATTSSHWLIQLRTSSSAQIAWINTNIEPGVLVKKGTHLAKLNTSALEYRIAEANSSVKQAELNLKHIQHEQTVALKMLSSARSSSFSSPFARREPQVAVAKAELEQAKHAHRSAIKLLEEATITAPFDAIIIHRNISPGEWLEAGHVTFVLAASESLDIKLPVSEHDWQQLQDVLNKPDIKVQSRDGHLWPAQIRYVQPHADPVTRQKQVVLSVNSPYQEAAGLLPNQQVKVIANLGGQPQTVRIPLSAMTRDGYVWTIDEQNQLRKESVQQIENTPDWILVRFEHDSSKARKVVVYPLQSMLSGRQVSPNRISLSFTQ